MKKTKKWMRCIIAVLLIVVLFQSGNLLRLFFPVQYIDQIKTYSRQYDVDPYLVMSVIKAESNFELDAVSHKQAQGLMQLTPSTARWLAERLGLENFSAEEMHNPDMNIRLGCYYISYLDNMYEGNIKCALAAYNAGCGTVDQWLENEKYSKDGETLFKIPYRETEQYVNKVLTYRKIYRILYRVREGRKV